MNATVRVSGEAAENMLARMERGLRFQEALKRAATTGASMVTGIPRDTGRLAGSVHGVVERGGMGNPSALIVSDVPYARPVFGGWTDRGGTKHAARPPHVPSRVISRLLAAEVQRQVFAPTQRL